MTNTPKLGAGHRPDPPKYGQTAITPGENQGRATIRKTNQFKPAPEILYIREKWVNYYIARENEIHFY